jgi:AcrR family transcriptional regulator
MAAHLRATGDVGISLRELAAIAGTSHFLLSYHFGSRHGVLGAVLHQLRGQDVRVVFEKSPSRRAAMESAWRHYTGPAGSLELRLFYHLVGLAAGNAEEHAAFVEGVVSLWTDPLTKMGLEEGLSLEESALQARYLIGAQRGLLLDWVLTQDDKAEGAYMALLDAIL